MSHFDAQNVRNRLLDCLARLSDIEYQRKYWVNKEFPPGMYDDFGEAVHFLFDDTKFATDISVYLGNVLRNEQELNAVRKVCEILDEVYDIEDWDNDAELIELKEWQNVMTSAKIALVVLRAQ